MYKFLPFEYTFSTRIKTNAERISWFIIFPIFLAFLSYLKIDSENWYKVTFAFLVMMSSYEIGYIYNDNITVTKEKNPTERVKGFCDNFTFQRAIIGCFIWFVILIFSYYLIFGDFFTYYLAAIFLIIQLVFYAHNRIRNRFNIITYLVLVSCRYLLPICFFIDTTVGILVFFIFPFCRTIEHACKLKYELTFLNKRIVNFDLYRVFYYFIMLSVIILFTEHSLLYLILYFFVYRCFTFFLAKKSFAKRNKHASYK